MPLPKNAQKKKLFISYRVQDTSADTGRLVDALKQVFYEDQIFMDIEKLEPGVDFRVALAKSLETCDVLFAVIGPNWSGTDKNGNNRITQPEDWVRIELETALKRDIRVIPVLMRDAALPQPGELPESLHPLLNRQTYEISNKRWKYDTDQLIRFLTQLGFQPKQQALPLPQKSEGVSKWLIYGLVALGLLVLAGLFVETFKDKDNVKRDKGDQLYTKDSMKESGVDHAETGTAKTVKQVPDQVEEEKIVVAPVDVSGAWYDAPNQYIMYINQSGSTLELKSVTTAA